MVPGGITCEIGGGALQEAADGVAAPSQAKETLASACGSGGAVSKQLMDAAVSGLVVGAGQGYPRSPLLSMRRCTRSVGSAPLLIGCIAT